MKYFDANEIMKITIDRELDERIWNKWLHDQSEESFEDYLNKHKGVKKVVNFDKIRNKSKDIERRLQENGVI